MSELRQALSALLTYAERNECQHEEAYRGGTIWTICNGCGRTWADDRNPFKPYQEPAAIANARAALAQPPAPTVRWVGTGPEGAVVCHACGNPPLIQRAKKKCPCKDRPADQCPGEWEPGCDLGANPAHVRVAQPATDDRLRMALRADLATESLAVDDLLRAMGEDPEHYRTDDGAVNRPRLLAWLKDRAAQAVQQPTADGGMAYHMGRGAYECSVLPARGNQVKAFGELTSIQQAEWVAKAAVHAALSQPVQQPGDNINCKSVQKRLAVQAAPAQRQPLSDEEIDSLTFPFLTAELGPTAYDRAIARAIEAAHGITAAPAAQKGEKL